MHTLFAQAGDSNAWTIVSIVVSSAAGIVGGLMIFNLTGLKDLIRKVTDRQDQQDEEIKEIRKAQANWQIDMERNMVSKEDWVRAEVFTRKELKEVTALLNTLNGKLDVVGRLPEIAAEIAARTTERVLQEARKQ